MKKLQHCIYYFTLLPFATFSLKVKKAIAKQRNFYENRNSSISFTLSEVAINPIPSLSQGFNQTNWNFCALNIQTLLLLSVYSINF
jgi:hypothetical protein